MNCKKILVLNLILIYSGFGYCMKNNLSENGLLSKKINIDYKNIDWGELFDKLPNEIIEHIFDYVFSDSYLNSLDEKQQDDFSVFFFEKHKIHLFKNGKLIIYNELSEEAKFIKLEKLFETVNLKIVNKTFASFILKNYSLQLKKISKILGKRLVEALKKQQIHCVTLIPFFTEEDLDLVVKLIRAGAYFDNQSGSPLLEACRSGYKEIVIELIKAGANVNVTNEINTSALFLAYKFRHLDLVTLLIDNGANVNYSDGSCPSIFLEAVENNDKYMILELIKYGVDINKQFGDIGHTALMRACEYKKIEAVKVLIDNGVNINLKNKLGQTVLDLEKDEQVIKLLKNKMG